MRVINTSVSPIGDELVADEREAVNESRSSLSVGDQVMVSVTHHIVIDGQDSWVKYGAATAIRPDESASAADSRVIEHVTSQVIKVAEQAAAKVMGR